MKLLARLLANTFARASVANTLARASVANTLARASLAAAAALAPALSGCATIIKGEAQTVSVTSPPVYGARCAFFSDNRYYGDLLTPGAITLPRSGDDMSVVCTKHGFKDVSATVSPDFNFVTVGNVRVGVLVGVVGLTTGVIVDLDSGANHSYPHHIDLPMERLPQPAPAAPDTRTYPLSPPAS
jgi:hypothetical protein